MPFPKDALQRQASPSALSRTAGATGLVGSRLVAKLAAQGHTARVLTRNMDAARAKLPFPRTEFFAPPQWGAAVYGARGVVNLAGAPEPLRSRLCRRELCLLFWRLCASQAGPEEPGQCAAGAQLAKLDIVPFFVVLNRLVCSGLRDCSLTVWLLHSCACAEKDSGGGSIISLQRILCAMMGMKFRQCMLAGLATRGNVKFQCRRANRHEVDAGHKGGNQALTCGRDASYCGTPLLPCRANFLRWLVLVCANALHACSLHMTNMC